jgi:hypothetical protein
MIQSNDAEALIAPEYVPAGQLVQLTVPTIGAKVPALQLVQLDAPLEE